MNGTRLLAAAAMTAGVAIGLAANANAAPVSDDFWECAGDHPEDIGVCCVFYGGDYDERTGECWIDNEAKPGLSPPRVWTSSTVTARFAGIKSTLVGCGPSAGG